MAKFKVGDMICRIGRLDSEYWKEHFDGSMKPLRVLEIRPSGNPVLRTIDGNHRAADENYFKLYDNYGNLIKRMGNATV